MGRRKDKLVQVEIYGQRYSLRAGDDQEASYVESLAAHVDRRMREIAESTPTVDSFKVAVLAAVNIADEYFQSRGDRRAVNQAIAARAGELASLLDEGLKGR